MMGAALGMATVVLPAPVREYLEKQHMPLPTSGGMAPDTYTTFEGKVAGLLPGHIDLSVAGRVHRLTATPSSTFWRGGDVAMDAIRAGDALLISLAPDWTIGRGWANLTRVHGTVSQASGSGYVINAGDAHHHAPSDVVIGVSDATRYGSGDHMSGQLHGNRPSMVPGTHVDVIGLRTGPRIIASTLLYSDPRLAAVHTAAPSAAPAAQGGPTFKGYATWFDCPNGAGRCGTCNTSKNNQAAWPALDAGCGFCGGSCCSCSAGCKNQTFLSCGSSFTLTPCGRGQTTIQVSDCGPAQNRGLCGNTCSIPGCSGTGVVVDLTKPTFARFYPPTQGCFPTTVSA
jgi:hypothetical protein